VSEKITTPLTGKHSLLGCLVDYDEKSVTIILEAPGFCEDPSDLAGIRFKLGGITRDPMGSLEEYAEMARKLQKTGFPDINLAPGVATLITNEEYEERYGD